MTDLDRLADRAEHWLRIAENTAYPEDLEDPGVAALIAIAYELRMAREAHAIQAPKYVGTRRGLLEILDNGGR